MRKAGIWGVGRALPERVLTNAELEKMVDTSDEWITTRTGIKERRIAGSDDTTSDLATKAAKAALANAGVTADEIDMIIVATVTPDMPFPATSCLVQAELGAKHSAAFDLSAGCSGFIYALGMAASCIKSGLAHRVLVIGVDILSRITDWSDRTTCILFGDGAGACVVGPVSQGGILATYLGADGTGGDKLYTPTPYSRYSPGEGTRPAKDHHIYMAGNEVFKFAVRIMGDASLEVLRRARLSPADIELFIPHQANIRIIDAAARRLGLSSEHVFVNVHKYGNTSAASIGIALSEAVDQGRANPGDRLVLVGFGAGLTWGAMALEWTGAKEREPA
ncbi:MAG: beta-ketoacyl-ACP synthase III [Limnochordia bacterium]|jgi:3-oxoacyl-[acyl-carrier-protein] synthase-3